MSKTEIIQIITGFIGSFGFALLFNIRGKRLAAATTGGFLSWLLFVLLDGAVGNEVIRYFLVAVLISLYAEIMARVLRTPTTTFITTSLVPLIPGGSLYYTMAYALESNQPLFFERALYTLQLGGTLALGIIVTTALVSLTNRFIFSSNKQLT